jgi:hypothetical protein
MAGCDIVTTAGVDFRVTGCAIETTMGADVKKGGCGIETTTGVEVCVCWPTLVESRKA